MNDAYYDHQLNIQTEIYYESYSRGAIHRYEPTEYMHLEKLFHKIKPYICDDDVLVDIGSGMHRVPIFAANQLQIQTKGVEINKQLYMHALKNIQAYSHINEGNIEAINCDILNYEIKAQDSIFFLFNPFSVHIFTKFIDSLLSSIESQRKLLILYYPDASYINYLQYINEISLLHSIKLEDYDNDKQEMIHIYAINYENKKV